MIALPQSRVFVGASVAPPSLDTFEYYQSNLPVSSAFLQVVNGPAAYTWGPLNIVGITFLSYRGSQLLFRPGYIVPLGTSDPDDVTFDITDNGLAADLDVSFASVSSDINDGWALNIAYIGADDTRAYTGASVTFTPKIGGVQVADPIVIAEFDTTTLTLSPSCGISSFFWDPGFNGLPSDIDTNLLFVPGDEQVMPSVLAADFTFVVTQVAGSGFYPSAQVIPAGTYVDQGWIFSLDPITDGSLSGTGAQFSIQCEYSAAPLCDPIVTQPAV